MIQPGLSAFFESGVSVLLGSRDGDLFPDCVRGLGARVSDDRTCLTVYLPVAGAARTLENLSANHRVAVCFSRIDHHSVQVKGEVLAIGPADEDDLARMHLYREQLAVSWQAVGISPRNTARLVIEPAMAVRLRIESVFRQTPGPDAGSTLEPGEALP